MTRQPIDPGVHGRRTGLPLVAACAALIAAAASPAFGQAREPDPDMGARLVEARCTACHGKSGVPNVVARCIETHGEAYLDPLLKRHHAPDDEARADIIAYLTCLPLTPPAN